MAQESSDARVVVITGAGTGIGQAAALRFAQGGFTVLAVGRRLEKLEQTQHLAEALPGSVVPYTADVSDEAAVRGMTERAVALGRYTCLVNNAGIGWSYGAEQPGSMGALRDTTPAQWREVMAINLDSALLTCHQALQHFGTGCSIVNVASGGGLRGMADAHAYATAKAGMINLTRSLARTYGPEGIRSNVVAPGFVATDMVQPVIDSPDNPFANDALRFQVSPLGRPGEPAEIAAAIWFMAVEATYCNGSVLTVDGGSLA